MTLLGMHASPLQFDPKRLVAVCVVLCCTFSVFTPVAVAQGARADSERPALIHTLQGMQFVGPLRIGGDVVPPDDVLSFKDGKFSSKTCRGFGFAPAPYWVRRDADGLHFRAELKSPGHGKIQFKGTFNGERLIAAAVWKKERWYWTLKQQIAFTGTPSRQAE